MRPPYDWGLKVEGELLPMELRGKKFIVEDGGWGGSYTITDDGLLAEHRWRMEPMPKEMQPEEWRHRSSWPPSSLFRYIQEFDTFIRFHGELHLLHLESNRTFVARFANGKLEKLEEEYI